MNGNLVIEIDDSRKPVKLKVSIGNEVLTRRKFGSLGGAMGYLLQNTNNVVTPEIVAELRKLKPFIKDSNFSFTPKGI